LILLFYAIDGGQEIANSDPPKVRSIWGVKVLSHAEGDIEVCAAVREHGRVEDSLRITSLLAANPFRRFVVMIINFHLDQNLRLTMLRVENREIDRVPLPRCGRALWCCYTQGSKEGLKGADSAFPVKVTQVRDHSGVQLSETVADGGDEVCHMRNP
jgi:hypothetical protein